MTKIQQMSVAQLRRAIEIKEEIVKLEFQLESLIEDGGEIPVPFRRRRQKLSAAAKARISAGMKAKWAKRKNKTAEKGKRKMSAAGRARISAAAKARWKKAKADGKTRL